MTAAPTEPRHVTYLPREPRRSSPDVAVNAGPGFDQVVCTMTGPAAHQLASIIAASPLATGAIEDPAIDPDVWNGLVVDLLTSAALSDPTCLPPAVDVPLYRGSHQ